MKKVLLLLIFFQLQQEIMSLNHLDSLKSIYYSELSNDSIKKNTLSKIIYSYYTEGITDSLTKYSKIGEKLSKKLNDSSMMGSAINFQAVSYMNKGNWNSALKKLKEALTIFENLKMENQIKLCMHNIAAVYSSTGKPKEAIKIYEDLMESKEMLKNNPLNFIRINIMIGITYDELKKINKAREFYFDAIEVNNDYDSTKSFQSFIYTVLGFSYLEQSGVYVDYGKKSYERSKVNLSKNRKKELLDTAFYFLEKARLSPFSPFTSSIGLEDGYYLGLASYYVAKKLYKKAEKYINLKDTNFKNPYSAINYYEIKAKINKAVKNYKYGFEDLERVIKLQDSIKKLDAKEEVVKYEFEIKQRLDSLKYLDDIKLEQQKTNAKEEELKAEKRFELVLEIGIFIILISLYFIYKQLKKTKIQKALIEEKQIEITDSINYAKKIQDALLISTVSLKEFIPESFIFFKPKDIVSGDFYWIHKNNNGTIFFTVADCTGHGVPGAFMSMIGNSLLNENIIENKIEDTGLILDNARASIIKSLHQKDIRSESRDGMDMALCKYNHKNKTVEYSGANNPLIHISGETINKIKGDSQPIGIYSGELKSFKKNKVKVKEGDMLYLFSDGFHDQFGGDKGKKYMSGKFYKFLLSISKEDTEKQSKLIENEFERWRGNIEQIDDVCVMGVKVT